MTVKNFCFDDLKYSDPEKILYQKRKPIKKIIGLDSEAYTTGEPFMFATSLGDVFVPDKVPECFFKPAYREANFVFFNMKYDSGAILYHLPIEKLKELWSTGKTNFNDIEYSYVPHKRLSMRQGKYTIRFWDIAQFFKSSLDTAAKTYLNKQKLDYPTKRFTKVHVKRHFKDIANYCIRDAELAGELGQYLVDKLDEFGIKTTALYSCASLSLTYFTAHAKISTVYRFWEYQKDVLRFACEAYGGGKFEVTQRGRFTGYEYDISSAYPYEIANLYNLKAARAYRSKTYEPEAVYGFLRVEIDNPNGLCLPCGPLINNTRIYPSGHFFQTITKSEYDYLTEIGIPPKIHDAYWLFIDKKRRLYKGIIDTLFTLKSSFKGKDRMLYNVSKIIMNSFYGKTCQITQTHAGELRAGLAWNPIHASYITANTRVKITRIQNQYKDACLAVHTDSVMLTDRLDPKYITHKLGGFEYVTDGPGIMVACGMYQINQTCAFKGFRPKLVDGKPQTWLDLFHRFPSTSKLKYRFVHVESWIEAMAKNHEKSKVNLFQPDIKEIDLNGDVKRIWPKKFKARDFIEHSQKSLPKVYVESTKPKFW